MKITACPPLALVFRPFPSERARELTPLPSLSHLSEMGPGVDTTCPALALPFLSLYRFIHVK